MGMGSGACRTRVPKVSTALTRILFSEIGAYCDLHGFDYGKRQDFLFYVQRLDDKFMEIAKKRQEEEERKQAAKRRGPRPPSERGLDFKPRT
jgi:hypothetical protein